jgi:alkyl sulfatase BDS1-like metallo-beta-lactamase superfamily hydrolase
MILIKKTIDSRLTQIMAEMILEDTLPIHMEIGRASGGNIDVLISFNPEDEPIYLELINAILEPIYSL